MKAAKKITKPAVTPKMSISEIVSKYPESAEIMIESGLHCIGCQAAMFETLGEGAAMHGLSKAQIDKMIKKINSAIAKRKR